MRTKRIVPAILAAIISVHGLTACLGVLWNEIYYLSGGESKVLYSEESNDFIVDAASDGDSLYLLWQDGVLSSLDSSGTLTELLNIALKLNTPSR